MSKDASLCSVEGCKNHRATAGTQPNGNTIYRRVCREHHNKIAEQQREENAIEAGFANYNEYRAAANEQLAIENGFANYNEYAAFKKEELAINEGYANATERRNALHPYRWALKTYCENVDSRLGFRCTTTIMLSSQLEVDHIDGNPSNNEGENLQTLCGCCHTYKTLTEKDYLTPGRKALGLSY
jgi:hypothetical protein